MKPEVYGNWTDPGRAEITFITQPSLHFKGAVSAIETTGPRKGTLLIFSVEWVD